MLIEQLYPQLAANPNYDVVLVGHIDSSEAPSGRSRRGRDLDRERVLNTAGVLSGGSGTCSSLDPVPHQGKLDWRDAGNAIRADFLRRIHHGSQGAQGRRRSKTRDTAKNRRVEIWLVPKGLALPAAARDAKELPDADLKKIGCPK